MYVQPATFGLASSLPPLLEYNIMLPKGYRSAESERVHPEPYYSPSSLCRWTVMNNPHSLRVSTTIGRSQRHELWPPATRSLIFARINPYDLSAATSSELCLCHTTTDAYQRWLVKMKRPRHHEYRENYQDGIRDYYQDTTMTVTMTTTITIKMAIRMAVKTPP